MISARPQTPIEAIAALQYAAEEFQRHHLNRAEGLDGARLVASGRRSAFSLAPSSKPKALQIVATGLNLSG